MNQGIPEPKYPRHAPPPSCKKHAEFVGTIEDIDVWWHQGSWEYWYNLPGGQNCWVDAGHMPRFRQHQPAFCLAQAHQLLLNP